MIALLAGVSMGLSSWLHCVAMCGPLSSMVVTSANTTSSRDVALYHVGRVVTYIMLCLVVGAVGDALRLSFIAFNFSLITGMALVSAAMMQIFGIHARIPKVLAERIRPLTQTLLQKSRSLPSATRFLVIGAANGLLPCGVSLTAIIAAATIPSFIERIGFMAAFGVSTVPALMSVNLVVKHFSPRLRDRLQRLATLSLLALGVLVVLRGSSLNIPFISPSAPDALHRHNGCCTEQ